ncbi:hypothetical protein RD792_007394 [Penstemon davidsonii]|uniref:Pentatricopeptide repeat-containing protein n=1 Tax=Penstemon davidsonii TaxID=160366 RepID=A0ABR0D733_9LAMI|nr:hypothetical protein RD792_007394 [Penstemon davidsonii]
MHCRLRSLTKLHSLLKLHNIDYTTKKNNTFLSFFSVPVQRFHYSNSIEFTDNHNPTDHEAHKIQALLRIHFERPIEDIEHRLSECNLLLSEELILNVLKRHRSDWKPAFAFFNWVCKAKTLTGFSPNTSIYNEIIDILGRMKRFEELKQVLDEMSLRKKLINERTYSIVISRFAAAHKIEEAIEFFHKIEQDFELKRDLFAFQTLLLAMCRYKHVEAAEVLFRNKKSEFTDDIKTWNIILNGWCVLGSLRDAKRFWKDTVTSNCKPDKYTYGIFINALSKSGKISTGKKLLMTMWEKGCTPDVAICNTVIDGLCFKKRIPEALKIFSEMSERNCSPNVATYNSLIKHLCRIRRMEEVQELLKEMEVKGGSCLPNDLTYGYLLKASKKAEDVDVILERMVKGGCKLQGDTYNLVLRLFMEWGYEKRVRSIWGEMEKSGCGPDQRSYTIMIHGLYDKGMIREALEYSDEMGSKGMVPEPRTKILVDDMNFKLRGT